MVTMAHKVHWVFGRNKPLRHTDPTGGWRKWVAGCPLKRGEMSGCRLNHNIPERECSKEFGKHPKHYPSFRDGERFRWSGNAGGCFQISRLLSFAKNQMAEDRKNFRLGCVYWLEWFRVCKDLLELKFHAAIISDKRSDTVPILYTENVGVY